MSYRPIIHNELRDKKIALFGASVRLNSMWDNHPWINYTESLKILENAVCIIDNNPNKQGQLYWVQGYALPVVSFDEFTEKIFDENTAVLISIDEYEDIATQIDCFNDGIIPWDLLKMTLIDPAPYTFQTALDHPVIPKTIHYCWFGGKPIPPNLQVCIDSWSRFCPDYEIVRWDELNIDINKNAYMKKGHELGIWSLVSDYVRADVIYKYGGVYLDTDVELIRNIDDLLCNEAFYGFEYGPKLNNGSGYGAVAGHDVVAEMLETLEYKNVVDSIPQKHTIFQMEILGTAMRKRGFRLDNTMQVKDGIALYPSDVFAPKTWIIPPQFIHITENTHSIHHYNVSYIKPLGELKGSVK